MQKAETISNLNSTVMSESQLKLMFKKVHAINALLGNLNKQATLLREISVNSAIAAGHVGTDSGPLNEIARQIGKLSLQLTEAVTSAHSATRKVSNYVLNCVVEAGALGKMLETLDLIGERICGTTTSLRQASHHIENAITNQVSMAQEDLQQLNPCVAQIQQVIRRIWSLILSLRVSTGSADDEAGSFFLSIAHSLDEMVADCSRYTYEIADLIQIVDRSLEKYSYHSHRGDSNAA